jgi:anti-anti-sigma factor
VGLESALLGRLHTYHAVIVDLEAVSFVDCAGLGVLLAVDRRARRTGRRILLANPRPAVARLLELTGYGPILDTRPSLAEALDSVGRGGTVPLE